MPSEAPFPQLRKYLGRSLDELICGLQPTEANTIGEGKLPYSAREASPLARDEKERALLLRYRSLPAKRRTALLDLLKPAE